VPIDAATRGDIVRLATRIDAAVPEDEALRSCRPDVTDALWAVRGGLLPRRVALATAGLEVLLVLGAALFVGRRWRRAPAEESTETLRARDSLALFVGALFAAHAWAGSFALLWLDTINDQRDVSRCLADEGCTTLGEATSVDGLHHAVAWLDFRALTTFLGFPVDALLWMGQTLNAVTVVLVAHIACRAGGRVVAAVAAVLATVALSSTMNHSAVYNTLPLPFLGAIFLAVAIEAVARPSFVASALTALLGALLTNVHSGCMLAGVSVVAIALLAPSGRGWRAALSGAAFAVAAFAMGPASWLLNTAYVWGRLVGRHVPHAPPAAGSVTGALPYAALFGISAYFAILERRRRAAVGQAAAALALPMLGAALAAALTPSVPMNGKYFAYVVAPGAVLLSVPLRAAIARFSDDAASAAARFAPFVAAVVLASRAAIPASDHTGLLTFHDLAPVPAELARRGWSYAHVYRSLKSKDASVILAAFELLASSYPLGPSGDDPTNVYVLKVASRALPASLPPDWHVVAASGGESVVMAFAPSVLDWSHFEACDRAPRAGGACAPSGLTLDASVKPQCTCCVPGMPPPRPPPALEVNVPIRRIDPGRSWAVSMPRLWGVCGGSVGGIDVEGAHISDDARRATWPGAIDPSRRADVRLRWDVGSPECEHWAYDGFPPFVLEGDADTVSMLEALVR